MNPSTTPPSLRPPVRSDAEKLAVVEDWSGQSKRAAPAQEKQVARPWDGVPDSALSNYSLTMPTRLHMQLKWLGRQDIDSSMRQFVIDALERAVAEKMKGMP